MALTPQQLADASPCYACIPKGMRDAVMIYLLAQLAEMTDPQALINAARCYDCIPVGLRGAVTIYLQDAILAGGGSGGSQQVWSLFGSETPAGNAIVPTDSGVAYNEDGTVWVWNKFTSQWEPIIV